MKNKLLLTVGALGLALVAFPPDFAFAQKAEASETAVVEAAVAPPSFTLSPAYPNPFNPRTSFALTVEKRQEVLVEIYNMLGQPIQQLFQGIMDAGETQTFTFDAGDLPSGIYLYRVQGETFTATRQVTLLK